MPARLNFKETRAAAITARYPYVLHCDSAQIIAAIPAATITVRPRLIQKFFQFSVMLIPPFRVVLGGIGRPHGNLSAKIEQISGNKKPPALTGGTKEEKTTH